MATAGARFKDVCVNGKRVSERQRPLMVAKTHWSPAFGLTSGLSTFNDHYLHAQFHGGGIHSQAAHPFAVAQAARHNLSVELVHPWLHWYRSQLPAWKVVLVLDLLVCSCA